MVPFGQFVLKVHSRCDLACDHCYVYEHADRSWSGRPFAISPQTAAQAAHRIAEHAREHRLDTVNVVIHGGEPLLLGVARMSQVLGQLHRTLHHSGVRLDLRIHTNGLLLDPRFLDLFAEFDVKVGVSLDGDRAANDRHRRFRDGRSSYDKVVGALGLLRSDPYRHLYAGLLCTIDIRNDPSAVYRGLMAHEPPRVDLLLPHATWDSQPPNLRAKRSLDHPRDGGLPGGSGEYGAWLKQMFDLWDESGRPVPVRFFDSVVAGLRGRPSLTESLGLAPINLVVIETDGAIEQADSLKTAFDGAPATGFNVFDHDLDAAAHHVGFINRQGGLDGLSTQCRSCPVVSVCGGGLYAHRYAPISGFENPSVYCRDLMDIIVHIQDAVGTSPTPAATAPESGLSTHSLPQEEFDTLGSGYGGADTIGRLAQAQQSIRRTLLARVAVVGPPQEGAFAQAWELLAALDESHRPAVDEVLAHPYVRAWAVRYLETAGSDDSARDLAHLGAIAASAALRAGTAAELTLPVLGSALRLPTFGAFALDSGPGTAAVKIREDGLLTIRAGGAVYETGLTAATAEHTDPNWHPLRALTAEGLAITLEDTDPYRGCHGDPADRAPRDEFLKWDDEFRAALSFIDANLPLYAAGLRAGLTAIMPMSSRRDGTYLSAAARHAFGAIGAARPADPTILALLLVHEFQHVKLGALLDLFDLYDTADATARHYAPWRPDPRPLEALLQGTYAHVAVTEFWRVKRLLPGSTTADETEFARWRCHTHEAVAELLASGSLTALGERFVRAMGVTISPWLDEPVSAKALDAAHRSASEHRAAFDRAVKARQ
jgi:uncharacterized protein